MSDTLEQINALLEDYPAVVISHAPLGGLSVVGMTAGQQVSIYYAETQTVQVLQHALFLARQKVVELESRLSKRTSFHPLSSRVQ